MKTRRENTPDSQLIRWGLNLTRKKTEREALATSAEPINNFFDHTDSTLSNLSNLVTGILPITHITLNFLMNALNSIPWISVFLNVLNGIFRAVRSLVMKQIDLTKKSSFGPISAYSQRIWLTATGIAGVALGLASMFVVTLAVPFTIASNAVDTFNRLIKFGKSIALYFSARKAEDKTEKSEARTRIFFKLETLIVSATSLAGTILLFTPLMPLGAGLLIASSVYSLADQYNVNPFKHFFSFVKNKLSPPKPVDTEKTTVMSKVEDNSTLEEKEKRMALFEKLYCQPANNATTKKAEKAMAFNQETGFCISKRNPMKLFQESTKRRPDVFVEKRTLMR